MRFFSEEFELVPVFAQEGKRKFLKQQPKFGAKETKVENNSTCLTFLVAFIASLS